MLVLSKAWVITATFLCLLFSRDAHIQIAHINIWQQTDAALVNPLDPLSECAVLEG